MRLLARLWARLKTLFLGPACSKCGTRPASLVLTATPTGKRLDGKTRTRTKTYRVDSCEFLCPTCRRVPCASA